MSFFRPKWAEDWISLIRTEGLKAFIKQKGWKVLIALILFYLVRDTILYIIIPYLAISKISGC